MSQTQSFAAEGLHDAGPAFVPDSTGSQRRGQGESRRLEPPSVTAAAGIRHSPWIAGFLAGFPGLGSIYNGSYARGLAFFLTAAGTLHIAQRGQDLWGFVVAFVWLFNMIDAYREARLIRAGLAHDLGIARPRRAASAAEGLGLGAVLLVIGLVSFLDLTVGIDVDWIFDLWPVGLMVAGAWFVVAAIRRGRTARTPVSAMIGLDDLAAPEAATQSLDPPSDALATHRDGPPPEPPKGW